MKIYRQPKLENSITEPIKRSMPYKTASSVSDAQISKMKRDINNVEGKIKNIENKVRKLDKDTNEIKTIKRDVEKLKKDIKSIDKGVEDLNIGQRRFWQQKTVFTSLQRKLERLEKVEQEWKKYKDEIGDKIRKEIEKRVRAQIRG